MQGLTPVKEYTSAAEMRAGHAAIRRRLMNPPRLRVVAPLVLQEPRPLPAPSRRDMIAHDRRILEFVTEMMAKLPAHDFVIKFARSYGFGIKSIIGPDRRDNTALIRHKLAWVLKREYPDMSYSAIAKEMKRDHTTILHSARKIELLLAQNDPSVDDLRGWLSDD